MAKATYSKPTSTLDAEKRAKKDWLPDSVVVHGTDPELSDNGFIGGISPEYQNYADPINAPLKSEKGFESDIEDTYLTDDADPTKAAPEEGEAPDEDDDEDESDEEEDGALPAPSVPTPPA